MLLEIDRSLKPQAIKSDPQRLIDRFGDKTTDWKTKATTQTLFPVTDNVIGDAHHANYLGYLELAWANHYGAILSPDCLWYTLLCEATAIVAENPERYRAAFTTKPEGKTEIVVETSSDTVIPLDEVVKALSVNVPDGLTEQMTADFTTTDRRARMARYAAFADMVSPYYSYSMFACGIPSVRLDGTVDDWRIVLAGWARLESILIGHADYFGRVRAIIGRIIDQFTSPEAEFGRQMFYLKKCGSGSQTEAFGWFTDLFRVQPEHIRYTSNFATHVATVKYKNLTTGKNFEMKHGLFGSRVEDDVLRPFFGQIVYEKRAAT